MKSLAKFLWSDVAVLIGRLVIAIAILTVLFGQDWKMAVLMWLTSIGA